MRVIANGGAVDLAEGATVEDLLATLNLGGRWVLAERNGEPVPRAALATTVLAEDDRLELVRAVAVAEGSARLEGLGGRRLYLCTPDRSDLVRFLTACIRGGVDMVQLRDKHLGARPLLERARLALEVCRDYDVPLVLNDRPDLALEAGADGVHVGQTDARSGLARRILGPEAIVGLSTHAPAELEATAAERVDYISTGPVEATPTKPGRPGTGLGYLTYAARNRRTPTSSPVGSRPAPSAPWWPPVLVGSWWSAG